MYIKYSPQDGNPWRLSPLCAAEYRSRHPYIRWSYDPWTGKQRSSFAITEDPFGHEIPIPAEAVAPAEGKPGTYLKYSPHTGKPWVNSDISAARYRAEYPGFRWRFNPWTGEERSQRDISSDPDGLLIVPPGAQLFASRRADAPSGPISISCELWSGRFIDGPGGVPSVCGDRVLRVPGPAPSYLGMAEGYAVKLEVR